MIIMFAHFLQTILSDTRCIDTIKKNETFLANITFKIVIVSIWYKMFASIEIHTQVKRLKVVPLNPVFSSSIGKTLMKTLREIGDDAGNQHFLHFSHNVFGTFHRGIKLSEPYLIGSTENVFNYC